MAIENGSGTEPGRRDTGSAAPSAAGTCARQRKLFVGGLPRCRRRRKPRGFPAQEALPAIYRTALRGLKGNRGFTAALRACGHGLGFGETAAAAALPLGFACLAALGFVLEILVVEEVLFSRGEYEIRRTVYTLENSVLKLRHNLCPVTLPIGG